MEKIKVLVVDDHPLVRRGVLETLAEQDQIEVVGEATDGRQAVEMARALEPHVVVMDLNMSGLGGLDATSALHTEMPQVHVLVFTVSESEADLFTAMRFGARGYLLKSAGAEELVRAILHIAEGGVIVSPSMATKLLSELARMRDTSAASAAPVEGLSPREMEVLQLVAQGASNKEIASALTITENTVKTHLRNILDSLHLANRSQAAAYAVRAGLYRPKEG